MSIDCDLCAPDSHDAGCAGPHHWRCADHRANPRRDPDPTGVAADRSRADKGSRHA